MENKRRYCILGGGGSFGLHTAKYLLNKPETGRVFSVGRAPPKQECFTLGVGDDDPRYSYHPFHVTYEHDLLLEFLDREKPKVIINFAAQGEGATSFKHSWRYFETNCVGLSRLVEALTRRTYIERFIHIGTSELYGSTDYPAVESSPVVPTSPYAASKAAFDAYLMAVYKKFDFPMNIIRPCNAYGEGQQLHRVIPKAFLYGLSGRKLPLHGGGVAEKSYIHNHDLARAIFLVSEHAPKGKLYNAGAPKPTSIRDVVAMVARTMNMGFDDLAVVTPDRDHQDSRYWLDSSAILEDTGWAPIVDWQDGLERMRRWVTTYLPQLSQLPSEFTMRA